tara:strand:- start:328 stop:555 length:228 start_codon:yes stop_codon:yes gene_type:complete
MSSKETVKAIIEVLKDKTQNINHVNDEVISSLHEEITKIIESMGYVKQERYEGLLQVIKHLENRINDLEKEHKSD